MNRFLSATRYIVVIPILAALLVAVTLMVYGAVEGLRLVISFLNPALVGGPPKSAAVGAVKVIDLLLLGTVMHIVALGLYELFIDDRLAVPDWLEINSLDDLKQKLISGLIVVMAVYFLEHVVAWDGEGELLNLGVAIASVIATLAFYLGAKPTLSLKSSKSKPEEQA